MTLASASLARWLPPAVLDPPEDGGGGRLLAALLEAVNEQAGLLEADIDQLWEDFFVESCDDWAIPYIAELVGLPPDAGRLEVAFSVALRRRKGTPLALEDFARVLTGWSALAVEGWQITTWCQRLGHPRRPAALDLRAQALTRTDTPFEPLRRAFTPSRRWSPRAVTALVWPWQLRTFRAVRARPLGSRRYALHPLGVDAPLYVRPSRRGVAGEGDDLRRTADERDAPVRATYRVLRALAGPGGEIAPGATTWAVGDEHPLALNDAEGRPRLLALTSGSDPIPWSALRFGSVTTTSPAPANNEVVVDLARGRVHLGTSFGGGVRAIFHRPVSGSIGALGGETRADVGARVVVSVQPRRPPSGTQVKTLAAAFALAETLSAQHDPAESEPGRVDVELRLDTSDSLRAPPAQTFSPRLKSWRIVAPTLMTPTVRGSFSIDLEGADLALEGFLLSGDLRLGTGLRAVSLRSLTMNPPGRATLFVEPGAWTTSLEARGCFLAPIRADLAAAPVRLADCVVDGLGRALRVCETVSAGSRRPAVDLRDRFAPELEAAGVTFVGPVAAEEIDAVDCLFVDGLGVLRQQSGCLRHCYLGPAADRTRLPTTYRCLSGSPPHFVSEAFEAGGYFALDLERNQQLHTAASDGGEVGAYHHAGRAAGLAQLRTRVHEFVPLGLRADVALAPWEER